MRSRRFRKPNLPTQNLDSFLDILTNTVGVLMFISLFITLITVESSTVVRTPLVSNSKKTPRFFEIKENRITYVDDQAIDAQIANLLKSLPSCEVPDLSKNSNIYDYQSYLYQLENYEKCRLIMIDRLSNFQGTTDYYRVKFIENGSLLYQPLETVQGELSKEINEPESTFNQTLKSLNPQKDYLAFIVRPDSFSAFRTARKEAWEQGFEVGWEPLTSDTPIVFSSGGRAVGIQ